MRIREDQLVKVMETGETLTAGSITFATAMQIAHIRTVIFKNGIETGHERLRMSLYFPSGLLHSRSEWLKVKDIGAPSSSWFGWLRFDFLGEEWVHPSQQLVCQIESSEYTRDGDNFFLSFALDFGMQSHGSSNAFSLEAYGYTTGRME